MILTFSMEKSHFDHFSHWFSGYWSPSIYRPWSRGKILCLSGANVKPHMCLRWCPLLLLRLVIFWHFGQLSEDVLEHDSYWIWPPVVKDRVEGSSCCTLVSHLLRNAVASVASVNGYSKRLEWIWWGISLILKLGMLDSNVRLQPYILCLVDTCVSPPLSD